MTDRPPETSIFDAVLLEVLWTRLISIADEAAKAIVRTAFSTLSNEANDFACVLTDARGRSLAQNSGSIPSFIATLPATVRHFMDAIGAENMRPGDILITNDPWKGTGHLPDVCIVRPLFRAETLIAFAATTSHVPDIGGRIRAMQSREIYEEGLQIPLTKLVNGGVLNEQLIEIIRLNVRTPDQTMGDIWAQVGANDLMAKRLEALMNDYGLEDLGDLADELFSRCEVAMRRAIQAVPDGVYRYALETDGMDGVGFRHEVALCVDGDTINADYAGTTAAQPCAVNCPMTYTYAMTAYAVKCALLADLPNNDGMFRPITVTAPEDCLVNPRYPSAVTGRASTGHYVPIAVFGALGQAIPDKVMAGPGSPLFALTQTGRRAAEDGGGAYANVFFFNGGMGAMVNKDGESCLSWPSNISSTPVEVAERNAPLLFIEKKLRSGSGGRGKHRGGLGQDVLMESRSEGPIAMMIMAERTRVPAPGFADGHAGGLGDIQINGESINHRAQQILKKGDRILVRTPGGGGYGAAGERCTEAEAADEMSGYLGKK